MQNRSSSSFNKTNNRSYRTPRGTELPLLSLRGKEYLEVKYRLVWFREEHPDWSIETEILSVTEASAYARATIRDETGRIIATSHKYETKQGFPDFIEKAETGSIGRALALIGYGTQFCADELDEGERIVDAPVDRKNAREVSCARDNADRPQEETKASQSTAEDRDASDESADNDNEKSPEQSLKSGSFEAGDYRISFGKKYKGKRLSEIPRKEIESYMDWLEASAEQKGVPLSDEARFLKLAVDRFLTDSKH